MTCLQAVSGGNASAPGSGRGLGLRPVGTSVPDRWAQGAKAAEVGREESIPVISLSPGLGHSGDCGHLRVDCHYLCAGEPPTEKKAGKLNQRGNARRAPLRHQDCARHSSPAPWRMHTISTSTWGALFAPRLQTRKLRVTMVLSLPKVTSSKRGRKPGDNGCRRHGLPVSLETAPVKTGSFYRVPAPPEDLLPLPPPRAVKRSWGRRC